MKYSDIEKDLEKFAQQFGIGGKVREFFNIGGRIFEMRNSEYKEMIDSIKEIDNSVRNIVTGEDGDHESMKNLLDKAKTNINRREYLEALANCVEINEIVTEALEELKKLNLNFEKTHYRLLSSQMSGENLERLKRKLSASIQESSTIQKRAGILDFFHNIFSSRGRELRAWEKSFPKAAASLRRSVSHLLRMSVSINNSIVQSLKRMKEFRIKREIENYREEKNKLLSRIDSYLKGYHSYYSTAINPIIKQVEEAIQPEHTSEEYADEDNERRDAPNGSGRVDLPKVQIRPERDGYSEARNEFSHEAGNTGEGREDRPVPSILAQAPVDETAQDPIDSAFNKFKQSLIYEDNENRGKAFKEIKSFLLNLGLEGVHYFIDECQKILRFSDSRDLLNSNARRESPQTIARGLEIIKAEVKQKINPHSEDILKLENQKKLFDINNYNQIDFNTEINISYMGLGDQFNDLKSEINEILKKLEELKNNLSLSISNENTEKSALNNYRTAFTEAFNKIYKLIENKIEKLKKITPKVDGTITALVPANFYFEIQELGETPEPTGTEEAVKTPGATGTEEAVKTPGATGTTEAVESPEARPAETQGPAEPTEFTGLDTESLYFQKPKIANLLNLSEVQVNEIRNLTGNASSVQSVELIDLAGLQ